MPRFNAIKNNFLKGEISPRFFGRTDLEEYFQGAETLENGIVRNNGSFEKRRGSEFQYLQVDFGSGNVALSGYVRLIPYIDIDGSKFLVVIRPHASAALAIVDASDGTSESLTQVNGLSGFTTDRPDASLTTEQEIRDLQYVQVGRALFIAGPNTPLFWIINSTEEFLITSGNNFKWGRFYALIPGNFSTAQVQRIPFRDQNVDSNNQFSITAGVHGTVGSSITISDVNSSVTSTKVEAGWEDGMTVLKFNSGAAVITGVDPIGNTITATVIDAFASTGATADWNESSWNGLRGHPRALEFFENRLYCGGNEDESDKVWATQSGDVTEWSLAIGGSLAADSPFNISLSDSRIQKIAWLKSRDSLFMGTDESEHRLFGPDPNASLSATNVAAKKETEHGSVLGPQAVAVDNAVYFAGSLGNKLREFIFTDQERSFRSSDVTFLSDHIFDKTIPFRKDDTSTTPDNYPLRDPVKITHLIHAKSDNLIIANDNYKGLVTVAVDRAVGLSAPTYHKLAGSLDNNTIAQVHSIAILPAGGNLRGEFLYLTVERTVDSSDVTYIERIPLASFLQEDLDPPYSSGQSDITDDLPMYMDSSKVRTGSSTTTSITGLDHLDGETVDIVADGIYVGQKTVASGAITLDNAAQIVIVGLGYTSKVKLLRPDNGAALGSSQRAVKRIDQVALRFSRTVHAKVGQSESNLDEINFRGPTDIPEDPIPLFTGDKIVNPVMDWGRDAQLIITSDKPYPFNLIAVIQRGLTND